MSVRALLLSGVVMVASAAPAFADSGTVFMNNVQGRVPHATPSQLSRSQVANELAQAQRSSGIQYLQVGEDSGYPPGPVGPAESGMVMEHRGANMPGGQGMMPDHPHQDAPARARSGKAMEHRGADMPSGQGMMPDHPHQERRR